MNSPQQFDKEHKKSVTDYECPVCYMIIARPAVTPCKHLFCIDCITKVVDLEKKCPCCRGHLDYYEPHLDTILQDLIKKYFPVEFEQREKVHEEEEKIKARLIKKKIVYGNSHSYVTEHGVSSNFSNNHLWKVFLKLDGDEPALKLIRKVTFMLHPTFRQRQIDVYQEPFEVERIGWGIFEIPIIVYFKKGLNLQPLELSHFLSFSNNGKFHTSTVEIDKQLLEKPQH